MDRLAGFAHYSPLVTAVLAPLATLMDIPALTQRWYTKDGIPQDDAPASLALSAVGLGLNVVANVLLIMRFSSKTATWIRWTVIWSLSCWIAKTVVAVVNLAVFSGRDGCQYTEGFWSAVVSVCVAGIITIALLIHFFFAFKTPESAALVRSSGRKFMLSVTVFIIVIAIQSLIFSRIEHWSYADGIYFSVQTALTIGYGDYVPTTTAGKVLIFPFAILTISQLGNEISLIIAFISDRSKERRRIWRRKYEGAIYHEAEMLNPNATLVEEMKLVHDINERETWLGQMIDLVWSAISLIAFWLLGALVFSRIEGWTYGNAIYACMVMSITIGFGDYTPETPAGKIVWIPYVLLAVPIVTSFAVQTITGLLSTFSNRTNTGEAVRKAADTGTNWCRPHTELVEHHRGVYRRIAATHPLHPAARIHEEVIQGIKNESEDHEVSNYDRQAILVQQLLSRMIKLEAQAREMLLEHLDRGLARTLLVADRNVQARNVGLERDTPIEPRQTPIDELLSREERPESRKGESPSSGRPQVDAGSDEPDVLQQVQKYRSLFAEILFLGSVLQKLDGDERNKFERLNPSLGSRPRTKDELERVKSEVESRGRSPVTDHLASLRGLTKMLYRQQTKKLSRTYSVAE